jgi:replicative DNA helicase
MDNNLPMNVEAEKAVIGSILIDSDAILYTDEIVKPDDFFVQRNKWIYEAIVQLYRNNNPIDILAIEAQLKRNKRNIETSYLISLINVTPTSIHAPHLCRID